MQLNREAQMLLPQLPKPLRCAVDESRTSLNTREQAFLQIGRQQHLVAAIRVELNDDHLIAEAGACWHGVVVRLLPEDSG